MKQGAKTSLNYPLAISAAIHMMVMAFFSLGLWNSPEVVVKHPPIHIKKIILEEKKSAPPKKQNARDPLKAFKPTAAAQFLRKRPDISDIKSKPVPTTHEALNSIVPINREKAKPFQRTDLKPISPASFVVATAKPATYLATNVASIKKPASAKPRQTNTSPSIIAANSAVWESGSKTQPRRMQEAQAKPFSGEILSSYIKPAEMENTAQSYSPKPRGKPMQIASIPKGFIDDLPGEKKLADSATSPGEMNGISNSNGADLDALKEGFSSQVWARIAKAKFYPRKARKKGIEGRPMVEFELRNDGQLINYFIALSSSYDILDQAAIDAVKNASPYPRIPEPLKLNSIRFKLPISFIINEP